MKIGLTGGIGTGKTTVTKYLLNKGYKVIDADLVARQVVEKGSPALAELAQAFGEEVILKDGTLDRKKLRQIAFSSEKNTEKLNEITHGRICGNIREELDKSKDATVFVDAPLLFEVGLDQDVDQVWVLVANKETRIERIKKRDEIGQDQAEQIIDKQLGDMEKIEKAQVIIENNGSEEELFKEIDKLLQI